MFGNLVILMYLCKHERDSSATFWPATLGLQRNTFHDGADGGGLGGDRPLGAGAIGDGGGVFGLHVITGPSATANGIGDVLDE